MIRISFVVLLLLFVVAIIFSSHALKLILKVAHKKKLYDAIDERKCHQTPIPRLGGATYLPVATLVLSLLFLCIYWLGETKYLPPLPDPENTLGMLSIGVATFCLYIVGLIDDLIGVRYLVKIVVQLMASILLVKTGLYVYDLYGFLWVHSIPIGLAYGLSILIFMLIINAINLVDGIDGLASGIGIVSFLYYALTSTLIHNTYAVILCVIGVGILIPFFYFNYFKSADSNKKIFMGDTGSLTLGIVLATLSVLTLNRLVPSSEYSFGVLAAFSPVILPSLDVIRVFFYRIATGRSPFSPDKNHIHHLLLACGLTHRKATIILLAIQTLFIAIAFFFSKSWLVTFIVIILIYIAIVVITQQKSKQIK